MLRFLSNMAGLFLVLIVGLMLVGGIQAKTFWAEKWTVVSAWIDQSGKAVDSFPEQVGLAGDQPQAETVEHDVDKVPSETAADVASNPPVTDVVTPEPIKDRPSHVTGSGDESVTTQVMANEDVIGATEPAREQYLDQDEPVESGLTEPEPQVAEAEPEAKRFTESEKRQFEAEANEFGERALQAFNNIDTVLGRN